MRTSKRGSTRLLLNLLGSASVVGIVSLIRQVYGVQDFIDSSVRAEIQQEIGRLRSHLRPDESLTYYFVGDYDLSPILAQLPGVKYTWQQTIELSSMCAAGEERTKLMVMTAIGNLLSRGIIAPKQREVEAELEGNSSIGQVKQERISQLIKHFGGGARLWN